MHNFNFYLAKNTRSLESCKDEGAHLRATVLLKRAMMRTEQLLGMSRPVLTEIFEFQDEDDYESAIFLVLSSARV